MEIVAVIILVVMVDLILEKRSGVSPLKTLWASICEFSVSAMSQWLRFLIVAIVLVVFSHNNECTNITIFIKLLVYTTISYGFKVLNDRKINSVTWVKSTRSNIYEALMRSMLFVAFVSMFMWRPGSSMGSVLTAMIIMVPVLAFFQLRSESKTRLREGE